MKTKLSCETCAVIPRITTCSSRRPMKQGNFVSLDPKERSADALEFERNVRSQVIGQEEAILAMSDSIQIYMAGLNNPNRTVANLLFLGPTGVGKTRVVEAAAKALFGTERAILK